MRYHLGTHCLDKSRAHCWQEWQDSVRDAVAVTAEDGSVRVNSMADNLRDWSRLVNQTLQGADRLRGRQCHHAILSASSQSQCLSFIVVTHTYQLLSIRCWLCNYLQSV